MDKVTETREPGARNWKASQRDWLVRRLRGLLAKWQAESAATGTVFSPDVEVDRIAKGRTGGCSVELHDLLKELE